MRAPKYYCTMAVWLVKDKFTLWLPLGEKIGNLLGGASWKEPKWNDGRKHTWNDRGSAGE